MAVDEYDFKTLDLFHEEMDQAILEGLDQSPINAGGSMSEEVKQEVQEAQGMEVNPLEMTIKLNVQEVNGQRMLMVNSEGSQGMADAFDVMEQYENDQAGFKALALKYGNEFANDFGKVMGGVMAVQNALGVTNVEAPEVQ